MLLIDGVKYQEWTDLKEIEDLEPMVSENAKYIFGEKALYIDRKQKLKSLAGIGSIPDAYVISLEGNSPHWHIVEIELSYKDPRVHLVTQLNNFINGMKNSRNVIVTAINQWIKSDSIRALEFKRQSKCEEIHEFLAELIGKAPVITIIIEKHEPKLNEAIQIFKEKYDIEVKEFRTFRREGAEAVHAHLFEPVYAISPPSPSPPSPPPSQKGNKVTFAELVKAGLLLDGQVFYFYNTRPFMDERAHAIASENKFRYQADGKLYSKTSLAERLFKKYGFEYIAIRGPKHWKTEDGRLLVELEEQVRIQRGGRK